jgi:hypothetical protein
MNQNLRKKLQNLRKRTQKSNVNSIHENEINKANVIRLKQQLDASLKINQECSKANKAFNKINDRYIEDIKLQERQIEKQSRDLDKQVKEHKKLEKSYTRLYELFKQSEEVRNMQNIQIRRSINSKMRISPTNLSKKKKSMRKSRKQRRKTSKRGGHYRVEGYKYPDALTGTK